MSATIPTHYKETTISNPGAIGGGIASAAKTATDYVTEIDNSGITVHPKSLNTSRVKVDASGTTVYQNNEDVAFYGATSRIGKANADRVVVDPTNGITIYKSGSYTKFDSNSMDLYSNAAANQQVQHALQIDTGLTTEENNVDYVGSRIQFSPDVALKLVGISGVATPLTTFLDINALREYSNTLYGPRISLVSNSSAAADNVLSIVVDTSANSSQLTITPLEFDFYNSDVTIRGGKKLQVLGTTGAISLVSTSDNMGLRDESVGAYLIRKDANSSVYLNGHNITDVDDHKFYAAPSGGGEAYFRTITNSDIPSSGPTSIPLNSATNAYSSGMTPKYRKWGNVVNVYGAVSPKSEVAAGGSLTIGTLPSGFRPSLNSVWLCQGSGNAVWALSINSDGTMTASRYRNGASTNAAIPTSAWLIFNVTYVVS